MDSPVRGFSHVQLRVTDVDASAAWYAAVLGVEPTVEPSGGNAVLLGNGGRYVVVIGGGRPEGAGGEVDHLAFAVGGRDALAAWAESLAAAGIEHGGLVEADEGLSIHLTDPDGLAVELIAP
ncbi:MAG TPA: VOC family protein [Acidimicrobiales bacterium]